MKRYQPLWVDPATHQRIKLQASMKGLAIKDFLKDAFKDEEESKPRREWRGLF